MTDTTLRQVDTAFETLVDPYRRELTAYCYRMVGSVHDAEDLVQETYLRAWRAFDRFEGRSSVRTWLYRIATNTCLTALDQRTRRPLPTGLGAPACSPDAPLEQDGEVPWLQPLPDAALAGSDGSDGADPATVVDGRAGVRLAFVAALQHLPPRQRCALVLRDVLAWSAAETATAMEVSVPAANSLLQRARTEMQGAGLEVDRVTEDLTPEQRRSVEAYARAMERKDVTTLVGLLTADARWEMPPFTGWYAGAADIGRLVEVACPAGPGELLMVPTAANGQPAFGMYILDRGGDQATGQEPRWVPFQLQVLALDGDRVAHVTAFFDLSLYEVFGLPASLPFEGDLSALPAQRGGDASHAAHLSS